MLNPNLSAVCVLGLATFISSSQTMADSGASYQGDDNTVAVVSAVRPRKRSSNEMPNDAWSVDVSRSSDFCYQENSHISLWRANAEQMDKLQLRDIKGTQISLRWPSEQHDLTWPQAKLPLLSDNAYSLRLTKTSDVERQITMHKIPNDLSVGSAKFVAWMNEKGCHLQAAMLQKP